MANLDHEAIRKAYPDAAKIDDSYGAFKEDGTQITLVQSNIDAARVELDKLNYKIDRVGITSTTIKYGSIADQLDQLWHDIDAGKFGSDAKTGSWYVGITSVKTSHPKP